MNISLLRSPLQSIDSNQSANRSLSAKSHEPNFNFQFQISKQKLSTVPDMLQENNVLYMSPRNLKIKTFGPTNNCRSPLTQRKELKTIQSPYNLSLHKAQSPTRDQRASLIQQDSEYLREKNNNLQKQIVNLESAIQRGQSNVFLKELQQKIKLLSGMNEKLKKENEDLLTQRNIEGLKKQLAQQEQVKKLYQKQFIELQENISKFDCSKFHQEKSNSTDYITQLILDLEGRVHVLIVENGNLNKDFNQRIKFAERFNTLELQLRQTQVQFQKSKLEERLYKIKFNQLKLSL